MLQIKAMKDAAMVAVDTYVDMKDTMSDVDGKAQQQAIVLQAKPFISLLTMIGEVYQVSVWLRLKIYILVLLPCQIPETLNQASIFDVAFHILGGCKLD